MKHQIIRKDFTIKEANEVRERYQKHQAKLDNYIDRLLWWNKKINLVSRDVPRETVARHVEHSLVISGSKNFTPASNIMDAGTGGGLPGIPLAIVSPEKTIILNDVVSKKIMACKHIVSGLGLKNVQAGAKSIEQMKIVPKSVIVSKHAFKINDLTNMLQRQAWETIILLKGGNEVEGELEGVEEPLKIEIINLEEGFDDSFYNGKAMVVIQRMREE